MTDWIAQLLAELPEAAAPGPCRQEETTMSDQQTPTQKLGTALAAASNAVAEMMKNLQLSLGALREEAMTALLVSSVQSDDPDVLVPHFPNEPKTGADLMWFVKGSGAANRVLLIQAKRLDPFTLRYSELAHTVGVSGRLQVDLLVETADGIQEEVASQGGFAKAFYFFYNYSPLSGADSGVFYMPAAVVQTLVEQGKDSLAELKGSGFYQPLANFASEVGLG